jgi:hypothetical protein
MCVKLSCKVKYKRTVRVCNMAWSPRTDRARVTAGNREQVAAFVSRLGML